MVGKGPGLVGQDGDLRGGREAGIDGGREERWTRGAVCPAVAEHLSCGLSLILLFACLQSTQANELRLEGEIPLKNQNNNLNHF